MHFHGAVSFQKMISLLFSTILAVVFVGTRIGECASLEPPECLENQQYVPCVNPCNNCRERGICSFSFACKKGCDCNTGFYKNAKGRCVLEEDCDSHAVGNCFPDEDFLECGCALTCCNVGKENPCESQCLKGCFCKDGLVRDKFGRCIKIKDCPKEIQKECGRFEKFSDCVIPCNDCNYRGNCNFKKCNKGCDCLKGYYRDENEECIPEAKCPSKVEECDEDEEYYDHKPDCKNTCDNFDDPAVICPVGDPGCFCKDGLVKREDGKCIPPNECPDKECGTNEVFHSCGFCDPTCETKNPICPHYCKRVCLCIEGLVRSKTGKCIPEDKCFPNCTYVCEPGCHLDYSTVPCPTCECPPSTTTSCGPNEEYNSCGTSCPDTCEDQEQSQTCTKPCTAGCFCKPPLVRDENWQCLHPDKCPIVSNCTLPICDSGCSIDYTSQPCPSCNCVPPPPTESPCKQNETYYSCGTACPETCENYGKNVTCSDETCVSGCFCNPPLVRDDGGECVSPEQCTKDVCTSEETLGNCEKGCPRSCSNPTGTCLKPCTVACFCKDGMYKADNGKCIPYGLCKASCGKTEDYQLCGPACQTTCDNYGKQTTCKPNCTPGCYCKRGLVRNEDAKCVRPEECKKKHCGRNEEFQSCGTSCPRTCDNYEKEITCDAKCVTGCFCIEGLVRNEDGKCVRPDECKQGHCRKNEEYQECGTACPRTCDNYEIKIRCIDICVRGCFCRRGLVRNEHGKCVRPEQCKKTTPKCFITTCDPGCTVDYNATPCPVCRCHTTPTTTITTPGKKCGKHEVYKTCGTTCPASCLEPNPFFCPAFCVKGCFCKKGYVRTDEGKCVLPENCPLTPQKCPKKQEYYDCKPTCRHTCLTGNDPPTKCFKICARGCFCRRGLVMNTDGKCIPPHKCPKICGKDEQYYEHVPNCKNNCGTYFDPGVRCALGPPGCFCKEGLIKRDDGECVKPEDC